MQIPLELKIQCVEAKDKGISLRSIYDKIYCKSIDDPCSFRSFKRAILKWANRVFPDRRTLDAGTYEDFVAHGATVQVDSNGQIVQAWIKQHADSFDPEDFIESVKGSVEKFEFNKIQETTAYGMLEIPLFDMHWGISFMDDYSDVLNEIHMIIASKQWDKIVIPFGQDFFHNDSIVKGETTKGTVIEKVDMQRAVKEGKTFICALIEDCLAHANEVKCIYSPGNHDKSVSWMFMQILLERYGSDIIDDSMANRKVISYGSNAIMVTHGNAKKATPSSLAHVFPIEFPTEFSVCTTREVHAGHLHSEGDSDVYGVMVRRLPTRAKTDEYSDSEDLVGTNKRFALFDWSIDKLHAIYYI